MPSTPKKKALGDVLLGRNRGRVLGLLFGNPDRSFYLREIANTVGIKPGTLVPELTLLTELGLLVSTRTGNQVFYKANKQSPIYTELKALVAKTVGVLQMLRSALEPISERVALAFVYGSFAKGEETAGSDVDLLVVGKVEVEEILERLQAIEKQIQREINPTVYSPEEFGTKVAGRNHFVASVIRGPKVFLVGGEDELGRLSR